MVEKDKSTEKIDKFKLDPELAIFEEVQDIGDKVGELSETLKKFDIAPLIELKKKYKIQVKGVDFFTPREIEEIVKIVQSRVKVPDLEIIVSSALKRIRVPRDGQDGKAGKDGTNGIDGENGENGKTPTKYMDYFTPAEQEELKEKVLSELKKLIPKPITALEIVKKLETLKDGERLDARFIKGLERYFKHEVVQSQGKNMGGIWQGSANPFAVIYGSNTYKDIRSITFVGLSVINRNGDVTVTNSSVAGTWNEEYPSSGVVNGSNKIFVFTHAPAFISLEGQALSTLNGDYTVSGFTVTLTNAPTNNPPVNKYLT